MNKNFKNVIILLVVCLFVGFSLSFISQLTAPIIENSKIENVKDSLLEALPGSPNDEFEIVDAENIPETITGIYRNKQSGDYAFTIETASSYSKSNMLFTVGIGYDEKIRNIVVVNYAETRDVGEAFFKSFNGKDSSLSGVSTVSGATYSSTTIKNAVKDAFTAFKTIKGN